MTWAGSGEVEIYEHKAFRAVVAALGRVMGCPAFTVPDDEMDRRFMDEHSSRKRARSPSRPGRAESVPERGLIGFRC